MQDMPVRIRNAIYALAATAVANVLYFGWYMHRAAEGDFPIWPSWLAIALINAIFGLFLYFSWRRHNWARWTVVVWSILGVLGVAWGWAGRALAPIDWTIQVAVAGIEVWACYQLLSHVASVWFRQARSA